MASRNTEPLPQRGRFNCRSLFCCGYCKEACCRSSADDKDYARSADLPLTHFEEAHQDARSDSNLDLSGTIVRDWPNSLISNSNVKSLKLGSNDVQQVPEEIFGLAKLEKLELANLSFEHLRQPFGTLSGLKKLKITDCQLTELPQSFQDLRYLVELSLDDMQFLKELTPSFGNLTALQDLSITKCGLISLPDDFGNLRNLETLKFTSNVSLCHLGESFGNLSGLKYLSITNCPLTGLPESFGMLSNLRTLILEDISTLSDFGPSFGDLTELRVLRITFCGLSRLPDSFVRLLNLEELTLHSLMELSQLCPEFGALLQLKELTVTNCGLTELPVSCKKLRNLVKLILRHNRIKKYPECIHDLTSLRLLDLSNDRRRVTCGNGIKELPMNFVETTLKELFIEGNPITLPPQSICKGGVENIKKFMKEVAAYGKEWLCADTINMIGETGVGKSSIVLSLLQNKPSAVEKDARTRVLEQSRISLDSTSSVCINDFGGHPIYQSVIPLFLPCNGLVILAYDITNEIEDLQREIEKWLLTAISKSSKIRIIVAGTHCDLVTNEQCSSLKKRVTDFVEEVICAYSIGVENCIAAATSSNNGGLKELISCKSKLEEAEVQFATVSCTDFAEEFAKFRDIVNKCLLPPEIMASRWHLVMRDILQHVSSGFPCLDMSQVQDMYKKHITDDPKCTDLPLILTYLADVSQILWLTNDQVLQEFVFHSPKQIVELCQKVLDHDQGELKKAPFATVLKDDIDKYSERGILTERLLKKMIPFDEETKYDTLLYFLQYFNLICEVRLHENLGIKEKQFLITSNLPTNEPSELLYVNEVRCRSINDVCINLTFVGSIVPLSFFETSVPSILNNVYLHNKEAITKPWNGGVLIMHDNVDTVVSRSFGDNEIAVTAHSRVLVRSPWPILYRILVLLQEHISAQWPMLLPKWRITCPACSFNNEHRSTSLLEIGAVDFSFDETLPLSAGTGQTFEGCGHWVPEILCRKISQDNFTSEQQKEITSFQESLANPVREKILSITQDNLYVMRSSTHGLCLIINNVHFDDGDVRTGSNVDAAELEKTFTMLRYDVEVRKDLSSMQMIQVLEETAKSYREDFDSFVCCILSHGNEMGVSGCDKILVSIDQLTKPFDDIQCPALAGKPKLFFIQACRGDRRQQVVAPTEGQTDGQNLTHGGTRTTDNSATILSKAHFLVSYSTIPGYVSYRNNKGSRFILTLCHVLKRDFESIDLLGMLCKVNELMSRYVINGNYKQTPQPQFTLHRNVFFGDYNLHFPPSNQNTNRVS